MADAPRVLFLDWTKFLLDTADDLRLAFTSLGWQVVEAGEDEVLELAGPEESAPAVYAGLDLDALTRASLCRALGESRGKLDRDETATALRRQAVRYLRGFERLFQDRRPAAIVVENGYLLAPRAAVAVARRLGVRQLAIENSFLKDRFFLEGLTGAVGNRHSLVQLNWEMVRDRVLTEEQREQLQAYLAARDVSSNFGGYIRHDAALEPAEIRRRLGVPDDRRLALLISQVPFDSVVSMDSPLYDDLLDFITDCIRIFRDHPEYHLVVRLHPLEAHESLGANFTLERLQALGLPEGNYSIVHSTQLNTYGLMDAADFGLCINSQAGLEMLSRGKPVAVVGDAFYARKGFTLDVGDRAFLPAAIERLAAGYRLSERQQRDIENFLYHAIFEYLVPRDPAAITGRLEQVLAGPAAAVARQGQPDRVLALQAEHLSLQKETIRLLEESLRQKEAALNDLSAHARGLEQALAAETPAKALRRLARALLKPPPHRVGRG